MICLRIVFSKHVGQVFLEFTLIDLEKSSIDELSSAHFFAVFAMIVS